MRQASGAGFPANRERYQLEQSDETIARTSLGQSRRYSANAGKSTRMYLWVAIRTRRCCVTPGSRSSVCCPAAAGEAGGCFGPPRRGYVRGCRQKPSKTYVMVRNRAWPPGRSQACGPRRRLGAIDVFPMIVYSYVVQTPELAASSGPWTLPLACGLLPCLAKIRQSPGRPPGRRTPGPDSPRATCKQPSGEAA